MKSHLIDKIKEFLHIQMIVGYMKSIVVRILITLARLVLGKYKPHIIGVTGSIGKTSTKDLIWSILKKKELTWKSIKSYNSDFGIPLTILGLESGWKNPIKWMVNIIRASTYVVFNRTYPKTLVLEVGADAPADIKKVMKWVKPHTAVVTSMGTTPVHVEFFASPEEVVKEKSELVKAVSPQGIVLLNRDDEKVYGMREVAKGHVRTFGFSEEADFRASHVSILYDKDKNIPIGMTFRIDHDGTSIPVRLRGVIGKGQIYVALAAIATAILEGVNPMDAIATMEEHEPPPGRARLISGVQDSTIIDDTYNSSPAAVETVLNTLAEINTNGRKIVVLGDMMELGKYTKEEHEKVGAQVAGIADELYVVGPRARFIVDAAKLAGFPSEHTYVFDDSRACGVYLKHHIQNNDIVLIKGSQSVRLERAVEEIMAEPKHAKEFLVRQDKEWKKR